MKKVARVFKSFEEAEAADFGYWLTRPMAERIAAVEMLRVFRHGTGHRLERVLVVKHGPEGPVRQARCTKEKR
ncbi:MAG: hypothetical protein Q8L14_14140 [Myxococcales bacterium]|nr:hypothetical protein [Myxococcales bacterium]